MTQILSLIYFKSITSGSKEIFSSTTLGAFRANWPRTPVRASMCIILKVSVFCLCNYIGILIKAFGLLSFRLFLPF